MRCLDWLYAWGWRKRALLLAALAQWLTALGVLLFVTPEFQGYAIGLTAYLLLSVLLILLLWDRRSIRVMVAGRFYCAAEFKLSPDGDRRGGRNGDERPETTR